MPVHSWSMNLFDDRIDIAGHINAGEISSLLANKSLKVLQFYQPVSDSTWNLLNDHFFARRPEVQLRAYGFYGSVCDLSFVSRMTHVQHFSADCLMHAKGVEHLAEMQNLESLGIGIYHLQSFDFLAQVTPRLRKLFLGGTRSRKPRLSHLSRFPLLEDLYLEGQQNDIEILSGLGKLKHLVLRSISAPDLGFISPLNALQILEIKLGGCADLGALAGMENIKQLDLWQIRGLTDIGVISGLKGLQYLLLMSLPRVTALPSLEGLHELRRISLTNMKGLRDLRPLEFAPVLEDFSNAEARGMEPEDYLPLLRNPSLKRIVVWFGSKSRDKRFNELRLEHGIAGVEAWSEFQFA
jgi:hypothetical protein